MDISEIAQKIRSYLNPQNLIIMLMISVYMPLPFTAIAMAIAVLMILIEPEYQKGLFCFRGAMLIIAVPVYALVVAFFAENLYGVLLAPVFFLIFLLYCFTKRFITAKIFETMLTSICVMVVPATIYTFMENITRTDESEKVYRSASYFTNANYFGTLMAIALIICAYRIVESGGRSWFYYPVALMCLVDIYLSASLFAIIEVIVGVAVYLFFSRHYRLFCLMVIVGSLGVVLITTLPELLPRLYEASGTTNDRVKIWGIAIREIVRRPFFGRGFLGYSEAYPLYVNAYETVHCHNIFLDTLLNFGIVGTVLLCVMLFYIIKSIVRCYRLDRRSPVMVMVAAILLAAVSHIFTDITFFWPQTGLLYVIIMGSVGCEERRLNLPNQMLVRGKFRV